MNDEKFNELDPQPETRRRQLWPYCLRASLIALAISAFGLLLTGLEGGFAACALILIISFLIVTGFAGVAFFMELLFLVLKPKGQRPSALLVLLAIPVWLSATILLIGIVLPPFIDSPERSKTARVRGDQRTLTIALETYYLDHNVYPTASLERAQNAFGSSLRDKKNALRKIPTFRVSPDGKFATLTTPVSYVSSYFADPFTPVKGATFAYWNPADLPTTHGTGYILWSPGPDGDYDVTIDNVARIYDPTRAVPNPEMVGLTYDPSNGAKSNGDIYRYKQ